MMLKTDFKYSFSKLSLLLSLKNNTQIGNVAPASSSNNNVHLPSSFSSLRGASAHDLFIWQFFIEPSSVPDTVLGPEGEIVSKTKSLLLLSWSFNAGRTDDRQETPGLWEEQQGGQCGCNGVSESKWVQWTWSQKPDQPWCPEGPVKPQPRPKPGLWAPRSVPCPRHHSSTLCTSPHPSFDPQVK